MATRILLVDDHQLMREGLRSLLGKDSKMEVVGEAGDGVTALRLAEELLPDIIIMDIAMSGMDGIEATGHIVAKCPQCKIIALSMHANKLFVQDMFKAGAAGYLLKECAAAELADAIRTVLKNEIYLSPKIAGIVVEAYSGSPAVKQDFATLLTERECEILRLLADGKSTKEIALQLHKSVQTVDASRRTIMEKLNMDSIAQLVKYAIREGLSTLEI